MATGPVLATAVPAAPAANEPLTIGRITPNKASAPSATMPSTRTASITCGPNLCHMPGAATVSIGVSSNAMFSTVS